MSEDREFYNAVNKALLDAKERFYESLRGEGYEDYISIEIDVHIISSDYKDVLETFKYSNLGSFFDAEKIIHKRK